MKLVLASTNFIEMNFAQNILEQEGINCMHLDNRRAGNGSDGLYVREDDFDRALKLLRASVPEACKGLG